VAYATIACVVIYVIAFAVGLGKQHFTLVVHDFYAQLQCIDDRESRLDRDRPVLMK